MADPETPYMVFVQGVGVTDDVAKKLTELKKTPLFENYDIVVDELLKTDDNHAIHSTGFGPTRDMFKHEQHKPKTPRPPKLAPWYVYEYKRDQKDQPESKDQESYSFTGGMGTIANFIKGRNNFFAMTAGHVLVPQTDLQNMNGDQSKLQQCSQGVEQKIVGLQEFSYLIKGQNHASRKAQPPILISYISEGERHGTQANNNMLIDIALVGLKRDAIAEWEVVPPRSIGPPILVHHGLFPRENSMWMPQEKPIAGILSVRSKEDIELLEKNKVAVFVGGRGDVIGTAHSYTGKGVPHHILFKTNHALMPGRSGCSIMVYNKDLKECYVVGLLHGKKHLPSLCRSEMYMASSLSASLDNIQLWYSDKFDDDTQMEDQGIDPYKLKVLANSDPNMLKVLANSEDAETAHI